MLLTRPNATKGVLTSVVLNKSDLLGLVNNTYFQDTSNWSFVSVFYYSEDKKQGTIVKFNTTNNTTKSEFNSLFSVSEFAAGSEFKVAIIRIHDFDGDSYPIIPTEAHKFGITVQVVRAPSWLTVETFVHPDGKKYNVLTWEFIGGATGYKVYRGSTSGDLTQIASEEEEYDYDYNIESGTASFFAEFPDDIGDIDTGTYFYGVSAFKDSETGLSPIVSVVVP